MDMRSELIRTCGMIDPHNVVTCLGVTKHKTSCRNRIAQESRKLASELLDLLAESPRNDSVLQGTLKKVSGLMLCKKNHQDQALTLFESWYQEYQRQQPPTSNSDSHRIDSQNNPIDLILGPSTPVALDIRPSWPKARPVSVEALRRKEVPFDVSPSQPAKIIFDTSSGHGVSVILRSLSQGLSEECSICRDTLTQEEPVSLTCETCRTDVHLYCMERWLRSGPMGNSYCPVW